MRQTWKPGNMLYPLPVVMVTTKDENKTNVLAVAWCGNACTNPPMVYISLRKSRRSYENIQRLDEFVINLVNEDLAYACDYSGVKSGKDVDKFKELNLHEIDIEGVSVKGIKESPVCLGCKVFKMIELGSHVMIIANVLSVNVDDTYLDEVVDIYLPALAPSMPRRIADWLDSIRKDYKVVVYGVGQRTEWFAHLFRAHLGNRLVGFVDGDKKKQGTMFMGYPIMAPEELKELNPISIAVMPVWGRYEIAETLHREDVLIDDIYFSPFAGFTDDVNQYS